MCGVNVELSEDGCKVLKVSRIAPEQTLLDHEIKRFGRGFLLERYMLKGWLQSNPGKRMSSVSRLGQCSIGSAGAPHKNGGDPA
eukprot:4187273-Amphidinium_carterae.1